MSSSKHLFISYARENSEFVDWLAKVLTREGYYVWVDRFQLLGGEPFPQDIEEAIGGAFRFIAVMSKYSKDKETPRKERMLASKASKSKAVADFIVPVIVDDLSPTDLDLITTDLTAIIFHGNWGTGFSQLLQKLEKIGAPKDVDRGLERLSSLETSAKLPIGGAEPLWSNLVRINKIPRSIIKFGLTYPKGGPSQAIDELWASYLDKDGNAWAFVPPPKKLRIEWQQLKRVRWKQNSQFDGVKTWDIVTNLIQKQIGVHFLSLGLQRDPQTGNLYFPIGLLPKDEIAFIGLKGKANTVQVVGKRTTGYSKGGPVELRYHIEPTFKVFLRKFHFPIASFGIGIYLTDVAGIPLSGDTWLKKRKKVVGSWFNNSWCNRILGAVSFMARGREAISILHTPSGDLELNGRPIPFVCSQGINEMMLKREEKEPEILDELEVEEDD